MKNWSRTNILDKKKMRDFGGKNSIISVYKKEILDTRIAVSEIAKENRIATPHILNDKQNISSNFIFE